jgi:hypothetical protein
MANKDSKGRKFFQVLKDVLTVVKVAEKVKEYWPVIRPVLRVAFEWIVIPIIVNGL